MRNTVYILLLVCFTANSQSTKGTYHDLLNGTVVAPPALKAFTVDTIAYSALDLLAPARGANGFYTQQAFNIPDPATFQVALDDDQRFLWSQLQPTSAGVYVWTAFDNFMHFCIDNGQRASFGIVTVCTTCPTSDGTINIPGGGTASYPLYVHTLMQGEANPDWLYNGTNTWVPNWNSNNYLTQWENFLNALAAHINGTTYKGVQYANALYKVDIRGFGNWGEWHPYPWLNAAPAATVPTDATLIRIINSHVTAFPNNWLILIQNIFDNRYNSNAVAYYGITTSNTKGLFGIRSDHLGDLGIMNFDTLTYNRTYLGLNFKTQIQLRYQFAPLNGEPMNDVAAVTPPGGTPYQNLVSDVNWYRLSQFSNVSSATAAQASNNYIIASKRTGYRVQVISGTVSNNVPSGSPIQLNLVWRNIGIAPIYENWNVRIDLRNAGGTVVWTGLSSFVLRLFLPSTSSSTDNFSVPGLPAGTYSINISGIDPVGYRQPIPFYNTNRRADGSYLLTTISIV